MRKAIKSLVALLLLANVLLLQACQKRLSGVYKDANNFVSLDFKSNGTVYAKIFGATAVGDYEVKDDKVIFENEDETMFIDIVDGETLSVAHPLSSFTGELQLKKQQ